MVALRSLVFVGLVAIASAQIDQCQPSFDNEGDDDGAAGILRFDVSADETGFSVNDFEFIADLSDTFDVDSVRVYNGSVFDEDSELAVTLVDSDDEKTVTTIAGEVFRLGLTSTFMVLPESTAGIEIEFDNNPSVCRYSEIENTDFEAATNGEIVRRWGALAVSAGQAINNDVVDDVVFHGGVCITTIGAGTLFVAIVNMTAEEVVVADGDDPVESDGIASATIRFDSATFQVTFDVEYSGLSSPVTQVALHGPALFGQIAGAQIFATQLDEDTEGMAAAEESPVQMINSLQAIDLVEDEEWYIQIITEDFADGELRGQIYGFDEATRTISFPLTVEAVETGLNVGFTETLTLSQRAELVSGTPIDEENDDATATGDITFIGSNMQVAYDFTFSDLSGNVTVAHFHAAALNTGTAAATLLVLDVVNDPDSPGSGTVIGDKDRLSTSEVQDALDGLWYMNLHTAANPNGEIRAQVNRGQATVINSAASGFAEIQLNSADSSIRYQVFYEGLTGSLTSVEIRGPAGAMAISDTIVSTGQALVEDLSAGGIASGIISGVTELDQSNFDLIDDGDFYIVLFSETNPTTGELRAQIVDDNIAEIALVPTQSFSVDVLLSVEAEINALDENEVSDALLTSNATGTALVEYVASSLPDSGVISWTITFEDLSGPTTVAHFHGAAGPTTTSGVRVLLAGEPFDSPLTGSANISDAMAREVMAGLWYINLHTDDNPATGELRGQIMPELDPVVTEAPTDAPTDAPTIIVLRTMDIALTTDAEIAGGTPLVDATGTGVGTAIVTLYTNLTLSWEISYTGPLSSSATIAHFHGPALANDTAGVQVTVVGQGETFENPNIGFTDEPLSQAQADDLLNGLWYINIHTENNAAGELRGQVVGFQEVEIQVEEDPTVVTPQDTNGSTSKSISVLVIIASITWSSISLF